MQNLNKIKIAPDSIYEIGQDKKNWFPKWGVKDDSTLYEKVRKLKYSTFVGSQTEDASPLDAKKFVKHGAVEITDNGIATNLYGSSKHIKTGTFKISNFLNHSYKVTSPIVSDLSSTSVETVIIPAWIAAIGMGGDGVIAFRADLKRFELTLNTPSDENPSVRTDNRHYIYSNNLSVLPQKFQTRFEFDYDTGTYTGYYNIFDGNGWVLIGTCTPTTIEKQLYDIVYSNNRNICIAGAMTNEGYKSVTLDLKPFSVEIEGKEVFSGCKTGIDTIKPTNFTAKANLYCFKQSTNTIYADSSSAPTKLYDSNGMLVAQSASSWQIVTVDDVTKVQYNGNDATYTSTDNIYDITNPSLPNDVMKIDENGFFTPTVSRKIKKELNLSDTGVFEVEFDFVYKASSADYAIPFSLKNSGNENYGQSIVITKVNNAIQVNGGGIGAKSLVEGTKYKAKIVTDCYTYTKLYIDGIQCSTKTLTYDSARSVIEVSLGANNDNSFYCPSEFDLSSFKCWLNSELVYQPCLLIPYVEAELNQKVVDVAYRDRVKDLFEQVGYNGYHTIDETNKNFTLPTHKFTDIIDHKEDADGTVAEQRVDMTVMAYGVAENGTDVNLPIEFADGTSYMVGGVTVSAKDADSFTPSSSGTWFARGKGKI